MKKILFSLVAVIMLLTACAPVAETTRPAVVSNPGGVQYATQLSLMAGEISSGVLGKDCNTGLLGEFRQQTGICVKPQYLGPVDLLNSSKAKESDVYLAEDSIWLGPDAKDPTTIAKSIVVVGIDKSVSKKADFGIQDLTALVQNNTIKPVICNANRCNAGALFYVSLLTGLKENPGDILTVEDVKNEKIVAAGKAIYGKVARGSNSSQEAADVYLADKVNNANLYNAIVVEEPIGADLNKRLIAAGKSPLQFVYLIDGTATTNLTLAYIDKGATKRNSFDALKLFLLDPKNQDKFAKAGFRGAVFGTKVSTDVLKDEWGLKVNPVFAYIPSPTTVTAQNAINSYIAFYKRPVMITICKDHSGSMDTNGGATGLKDAMNKIFDASSTGWLQTNRLMPGPKDVYAVYGFGTTTSSQNLLESTDPTKMAEFAKKVNSIGSLGGTAIYDCAKVAYDFSANFATKNPDYAVAIVLMTDGQNNQGWSRDQFLNYYKGQGNKIPVYSIAYGSDASAELGYEAFGKYVNGRYYDGKNLTEAFKQILGGN